MLCSVRASRFRAGFMAAVIGAGTLALPIGQYQVRADSNTPAATDAKIDLNTATDKDLETMPGVGTSTAKKIIAGRSYTLIDDLSKAGISAREIVRITPLVTISGAAVPSAATPAATAASTPVAAADDAASGDKVDLNTAADKDLERLPGVGTATAKKIIAARPYSSVDDLSKSGISKNEIAKLTPLVTTSAAVASAAPAAVPAPDAAGDKIDLNTASDRELETLPGVGTVTAKKIIAGRPYTSVDGLSKAGIPKNEIVKITTLVTASASASAAADTDEKDDTAPATGTTKGGSPAGTVAQVPPQRGMVWVNTASKSKVFHVEGDSWYGKTREGKFMIKADAIAAGYHEAGKSAAATASN